MHRGEEENERRGSLTKMHTSAYIIKQQQQCEVPGDKDLSLWPIKSNLRLIWTNLFLPTAVYVLQSKVISYGIPNIIWSSTWVTFLQLQSLGDLFTGRVGMDWWITGPSKPAEMNECEYKTCIQAFPLIVHLRSMCEVGYNTVIPPVAQWVSDRNESHYHSKWNTQGKPLWSSNVACIQIDQIVWNLHFNKNTLG